MRIGIVNDQPLAVEALRAALAREPSHSVLWVALDGKDAVRQCRAARPDIVLMDLLMPEMDGVEAVRRIMAESPCPILIVTSDVDRNMSKVFEAMGHGAMDVVRTPGLGSRAALEAGSLLHKIDSIGWLIGSAVAQRTAPVAHVSRSSRTPPLIAIGASAGGPAALETLLRSLPAGFPAAVVLVQHVDAVFAAEMAGWLGRASALPVRLAPEGVRPQPGEVFLAGTGDHLRLNAAGRLVYSAQPVSVFYRPSIDVLFDSIVEHWRGDAIGVLLTGMGHDGATGLKHMRERGFLTIAQDRASCAVYGMPKAAAELGAASEILPLAEIAPRLVATLM